MEIFVDQNLPGQESLSAAGHLHLFEGRSLRAENLKNADALIVRSVTRVDATLLEGSPVSFVGSATIGTDHVDRDYLERRGIAFAHAPGCNANSVGEYLMSALLEMHHAGRIQLDKEILGIVGYGHTGKKVYQKAKVLGIPTLVNDPPLQEQRDPFPHFESLDTLLRECSILSFHVPLTWEGSHPTFGMISRTLLEKASQPLTLINCARGHIMLEADVLTAVKNRRIKNLALDVFPGEPHLNPRWEEACTLMTPHVAGHSQEGKINAVAQVVRAFNRHFGLSLVPPGLESPVLPAVDLSAFPDTTNEWEALYRCASASYSPLKDTEHLKRLARNSSLSEAFEQLRNHYFKRYEYANYAVDLPSSGSPSLAKKLAGLGFQMTDREKDSPLVA